MIVENGKPELTLDEIMAFAILKNVRCPEDEPTSCSECPMGVAGSSRLGNGYICMSHMSRVVFNRESKKFNGQ